LVLAKVLARRAEHADALRRVREAVRWAKTTESIVHIGDAYASEAEVLRLAGRDEEVVAALEHALELYERMGHLPFSRANARRARCVARRQHDTFRLKRANRSGLARALGPEPAVSSPPADGRCCTGALRARARTSPLKRLAA
jgi:hypothetical protein